MIGIFDSGVGGLTILRRLRERLPRHDFLYLADQANVPYGDRTADDLAGLMRDNVAFLNAASVDAIVVGCNSSCGVASERGWPPSRAVIVDLIESAAAAVERSGALRIGVLATSATVRSRAYTRAIARRVPTAVVEEVAAPALVPLVEAGITGAAARAAVEAACEPFSNRIEALVLACSHYPVLEPEFAQVYGARVPRIDPAVAHARIAEALIRERGFLAGSGHVRYVTTGHPDEFSLSVRSLMGERNPDVTACALLRETA
ncbi:MAG TPA: glutamate racemase [Candidatus Binatia bacterium]|nr:glutamate racemase [Candidatus Binatia bacterium]